MRQRSARIDFAAGVIGGFQIGHVQIVHVQTVHVQSGIFEHFARPRAIQSLAQRAVGIDRLAANKALIGIAHRVQPAAAALDRATGQNHPHSHAEHDHKQQSKGEQECLHRRMSVFLGEAQLHKGGAGHAFKFECAFIRSARDKQGCDVFTLCNHHAGFLARDQ